MDPEEAVPDLERLTRQFREIRAVDFFDSPRGHDVAMLLRRAEGPKRSRQLEILDVKQYQGKTWLTRSRPEIDRVGSAWLIARFIDRKPKFVFASTLDAIPGAIPFDMLDAEFSHHGNHCTFETLTKRFSISVELAVSDIAAACRTLRELSKESEHEIHEAVIACARARRCVRQSRQCAENSNFATNVSPQVAVASIIERGVRQKELDAGATPQAARASVARSRSLRGCGPRQPLPARLFARWCVPNTRVRPGAG